MISRCNYWSGPSIVAGPKYLYGGWWFSENVSWIDWCGPITANEIEFIIFILFIRISSQQVCTRIVRNCVRSVQSADLNNLPRVSLWMANLADSIIRPFCTPTKEKNQPVCMCVCVCVCIRTYVFTSGPRGASDVVVDNSRRRNSFPPSPSCYSK